MPIWTRSNVFPGLLCIEGEDKYWHCRGALQEIMWFSLPTDRARLESSIADRAEHQFCISEDVMAGLHNLSREFDVPSRTILLAAFHLLLFRYCPEFGRPPDSGLSADPEFLQFLRHVQRATVDLTRQPWTVGEGELPGSELRPDRAAGRNPLVQVMFQWLDLAEERLEPGEVSGECDFGIARGSRFDLELLLHAAGTGVRGLLVYSTRPYGAETIARFAGHYCRLLEGIVSAPTARLSELPLLTGAERRQLVEDWSGAVSEAFDCCSVQELFEQQVARSPDSVAVIFEGEELTYGELNSWSNRIAYELIDRGVESETLVGLCVDRSPALLAGMLGILKAGCAYVPLDAGIPGERLSFVLRDTGIRHVLTSGDHAARFLEFGLAVLCVADLSESGGGGDQNPLCRSTGDSLAYVMYTSGSTGTPKGVEILHRGIVRLVRQTNYVQPGPDDCVAQLANVSFDAATFEIWAGLLCGGRVAVCNWDAVLSPHEFEQFLKRHGVTLLFLTTSLFNEQVSLNPRVFSLVRCVLFGGETADVASVRRALQLGAPGRLLNVYGPTENTTFTTFHCVSDQSSEQVPIGRPISNTSVYVLDDHCQLVPVGVTGELYIGGAGVARGYLNRPDLTAQRFVSDVFSGVPGARLYRTGDLCRWQLDGTLEFIGRADNQLKLRGFRIEPGEIESVLGGHPLVQQSCAMVREDRAGDRRLVAYCVCVSGGQASGSELRSFLSSQLPDYMIPSAFVWLDRFPVTSSGKLDRAALPAVFELSEGAVHLTGARTATESRLLGIWSEVLGLAELGIHDNFFAVGGHSLLAARVNARIRSEFSVSLPLRRLFEAPTVAGVASAIEELFAEGVVDRPDSVLSAGRVVRVGPVPLSHAQQGLWLIHQLDPLDPAYNIASSWRLRGPLDVAGLRAAFQRIVSRHEILRTTFRLNGEQPVQVIAERGEFSLWEIDLSGLAADVRESEFRRLRDAEALRPFDLSSDLMIRAGLIRLALDEHVLLVTLHHIVSDGWSLQVLWRELGQHYGKFLQGAESDGGTLPLQYADYAFWQRSQLRGPRRENLLSYWRGQLADLSVLELPTDRAGVLGAGSFGGSYEFELSGELITGLRRLAEQFGATLHMVMLAGFQVLLYRYSGQRDFAVGVPSSGRGEGELDDLIGLFVNTLVVRCDLSGDLEFGDFLGRVKSSSLEAYEHGALPFEDLVAELRPDRAAGRNPLVQVMFQWLDLAEERLELGEVSGECDFGIARGSRFDLELLLHAAGSGARGLLVYSTRLYGAETVARFAGHYCRLLEGIVSAPTARLSELPLLTGAERRQLVEDWSGAVSEAFDCCSVQELFEQQVARSPDSVAVIFEGEELTYGELNSWSNRIAYELIDRGVESETLVGLCVDRSPALLAGMLGILKAGCAYVPLDAGIPGERLSFVLRDTGIRHVLTSGEHAARFSEFGLAVLSVAELSETGGGSDQNPLCRSTGDSLAYVMYTSGSTGTPKGVQIQHASVVNFLLSMAVQPGLAADDCVLSITTVSFDISVLELLLPLSVGARICVLPGDLIGDGHEISKRIAAYDVTLMQATPATWEILLQSGWQGKCGGSRLRLLCGGESLSELLQRELLLRCDELWNMYGPTETTVWSSLCLVQGHSNCRSIGRPISNTSVYVLDDHCQLVPMGVTGELYIGGAGVARGYLNRPDLTAQRFVSDVFSGVPGERLYRTGDLCRWQLDGTLEFIGRADNQLKLRGFRIEPGEIEYVLGGHPLVQQSCVMVREDRAGDRRLVAYCVCGSGGQASGSELRSFLSSQLPDYMIPSAFVWLDRFPVTSSGKLDRAALPAVFDLPEGAVHLTGARTATESRLLGIWSEVLGLAELGIHDNFFAVGGHSLLAARVNARIRSEFSVLLPLRRLFEAPTVAGLAAVLESDTAAEESENTRDSFQSVLRESAAGGVTVVCVGWGAQHIINELSGAVSVVYLGYGSMSPLSFFNLGIDKQARLFADELLQQEWHGPVLLFGYSYGGLVATAMLSRLRGALSHPVEAVFVEPAIPNRPGDQVSAVQRRLTAYVQKLFRRGPQVLIGSVVFRCSKRWRRLVSSASGKLHALRTTKTETIEDSNWLGFAYRNIGAFTLRESVPGGAFIVAGRGYAAKYGQSLEKCFCGSVEFIDAGDVSHEDVVGRKDVVERWVTQVNRILRKMQG